MFKKIKAEPPSDKVRQEILRAVLSGRVKPGDRLPSEEVLAQQFGVSKTITRDALKSLKAVGLVEIRRGREGGAYIRKSNAEQVRETLHTFLYLQHASTRELYDIRVMLEPEIASRAASAIDPETLEGLKRNVVAFGERLERGESTRDVEIEFHRMLARSLGNPFLSLIMESIFAFQTDFKKTLRLPSGFARDVYHEHESIFELVAARDSEGVRAKMLEHMIATRAKVVEQVQIQSQSPKSDERLNEAKHGDTP